MRRYRHSTAMTKRNFAGVPLLIESPQSDATDRNKHTLPRSGGHRDEPARPAFLHIRMFDTAVRGGSGRACATPLGTVDALRVSEPLALRIKDVDLAGARLTIRSAKGNKDRMVLLLQ